MRMHKLTVREAASKLNIGVHPLRLAIQQNKYDWGVAVKVGCLTLCDHMNCSMPGLPVHHQLQEFTQTHVIESGMPSNHLTFCHPLLLLPSIFPSIRVFPMSQFFASGGQSIGTSASVLLMNTQD